MKELTLDNFLIYSEKYYNENKISKDQNILDLGYDGYDIYDFIISLKDKFSVDFSYFDFKRYFHYEGEITQHYGSFFLKKLREVEPITFEELFEYMIHHHPNDYDTEISISNLVKYIKNREFSSEFSSESSIIDFIGDGHEAYYFLKDLEKEFQVSFKNFDFEKYFHRDYELRNNGCLFFWLDKKTREVEELTVKDLYEYMIKHQK